MAPKLSKNRGVPSIFEASFVQFALRGRPHLQSMLLRDIKKGMNMS